MNCAEVPQSCSGSRFDGDVLPAVFVVAADPRTGDALSAAAVAAGYGARRYSSAAEYLTTGQPADVGVVVLDFRSLGSATLLERARAQLAPHPVLVLADTTDFDAVVRAFRLGAMDVVPYDIAAESFVRRVGEAIDRDRARLEARRRWDHLRGLMDALTPRERQVMRLVVGGYANKEIAADLGISEKTVEVHRHKVMLKMESDSLADLVRKNVAMEASALAP